jgi:hypothetical protein
MKLKKYKIQVEVFRCETTCCLTGDISIARNLISTLKMEVATPFTTLRAAIT